VTDEHMGARGDTFVAASAVLTVIQILNYRVWTKAARLGSTQDARASQYLNALPLHSGRFGATAVTLSCILLAIAAIALAVAARRRGASRGVARTLVTINTVAAVWLLSTMM
jgi:hypothetical protein